MRAFKKHDIANSSPDFDCNICLEIVRDPVVTLCGHLYCWPCIYEWILRTRENPSRQELQSSPQCPVCKESLSEDELIPLYGRGHQTSLDCLIPQRPTSSMRCRNARQQQFGACDYRCSSSSSYPSMSYCLFDPMIGVLGEMVCSRSRMSGGLGSSPLYAYRGSYGSAGRASPRRAIVEADGSFGRVYFFLCCCVFVCLLLF